MVIFAYDKHNSYAKEVYGAGWMGYWKYDLVYYILLGSDAGIGLQSCATLRRAESVTRGKILFSGDVYDWFDATCYGVDWSADKR